MSKGTLVSLDSVSLKPEGEAKAEALRMELISQLGSIPTGQALVLELEEGETIRGLKMRVTTAKRIAGDSLADIASAEDQDGNLVVFRKAPTASRRRKSREAEEVEAA